jgi:hypothetical protein
MATSMTLLNGDVCRIGDWALFSLSAGNTEAPALGRIHEIVVLSDVAGSQQYPRPDAILLQRADIAEWVEPYRMPRVRVSNNWAVANIAVSCLLSETTRTDFPTDSTSYVARMSNINVMVAAAPHQDRWSFIKNGRRRTRHELSSCTTPQMN